jgi:hypothetical protein
MYIFLSKPVLNILYIVTGFKYLLCTQGAQKWENDL